MRNIMDEVLRFNNVDMFFFEPLRAVKVLENLSFGVDKGTICAIIGPSGCGKSTILNLIAGLIKPNAGTIDKPEDIGYMFQKDNLLDWLSILDNVTLGLKIQKKKTPAKIQYAKNLLIKYGLGEFINSYPKTLSGGMRQRVALIRAVVTDPQLLLLDEPFSALDAQTRLKVSEDIYQIIRDLKITTVIVTHDLSEAIALADKIIVLTNRPATIKKTYDISISNNTPLNRRNMIEFQTYFKKIWGDINE